MKENNKVLLHVCCGICSAYPIEYLKQSGYIPIVYFFNPNIQPEEEYIKRLEAEKKLCQHLDVELIEEEYIPKMFDIVAFGLEDEPECGKRCKKCFELRLYKTSQKARKLGINNFTTSIAISPHKDYNLISLLGEKIAEKYDLNYLDIDFKKKDGFLKSNNLARELDLYRQNYCGCLYSKR